MSVDCATALGQWEWLLQSYEGDSAFSGTANRFFEEHRSLLKAKNATWWMRLQYCLRNLYHIDAGKRECSSKTLYEQIREIELSTDSLEYAGSGSLGKSI